LNLLSLIIPDTIIPFGLAQYTVKIFAIIFVFLSCTYDRITPIFEVSVSRINFPSPFENESIEVDVRARFKLSKAI